MTRRGQSRRRITWAWSAAVYLAACTAQAAAVGTRSVEVGVQDTRFTLNGKPTFLLGISMYGALGEPEESWRQDLAEFESRGFNWIRVWACWAAFECDVSAVDVQGVPREPFFTLLRRLVAACDERGIVVDVTLSRGNGATGTARLQSRESHSRAVETLVTGLIPYRNWYLDLANERNMRDARYVDVAELRDARRLARRLDPKRLVTASHAGDLSRQDLQEYINTIEVDFLSPHRPRRPTSPQQTAAMTRQYLAWAGELGRPLPIHYQEPFRRGFEPRTWEPSAEDFVADLRGAISGGAAGWCFHNGNQKNHPDGRPRRSFDLRAGRLFSQLDAEEQKFLSALLLRP